MLQGHTMLSRCASGVQQGTSTSQSQALSLRRTRRMKVLVSPALQVRHLLHCLPGSWLLAALEL